MKSPLIIAEERDFIALVMNRFFSPEKPSFSFSYEWALQAFTFDLSAPKSRSTAFRKVAAMVVANPSLVNERRMNKKDKEVFIKRCHSAVGKKDKKIEKSIRIAKQRRVVSESCKEFKLTDLTSFK